MNRRDVLNLLTTLPIAANVRHLGPLDPNPAPKGLIFEFPAETEDSQLYEAREQIETFLKKAGMSDFPILCTVGVAVRPVTTEAVPEESWRGVPRMSELYDCLKQIAENTSSIRKS